MNEAEYRWSSYRANAQGEAEKLLKQHPMYLALGLTAYKRLSAYRELFRYELDPGLVDDIRKATNGNYALDSQRFKFEIEIALGHRATPGKSGCPHKKMENIESGDLF